MLIVVPSQPKLRVTVNMLRSMFPWSPNTSVQTSFTDEKGKLISICPHPHRLFTHSCPVTVRSAQRAGDTV